MPIVGGMGVSAGSVLLATICTDRGPVQVALGPDGQPVPIPHTAHDKTCWFCLAHPGWLPAIPLGLSLQRDVATPITVGPFPSGLSSRLQFLAGRLTRAPPVPIA